MMSPIVEWWLLPLGQVQMDWTTFLRPRFICFGARSIFALGTPVEAPYPAHRQVWTRKTARRQRKKF